MKSTERKMLQNINRSGKGISFLILQVYKRSEEKIFIPKVFFDNVDERTDSFLKKHLKLTL